MKFSDLEVCWIVWAGFWMYLGQIVIEWMLDGSISLLIKIPAAVIGFYVLRYLLLMSILWTWYFQDRKEIKKERNRKL